MKRMSLPTYGKEICMFVLGCLVGLSACSDSKKTRTVGGLEYVYIPEGEFMMGCVPGDTLCWKEELPRRKIQFEEGFWMTSTEVTVGSFREFTKAFDYTPESERANKGRIYQNELEDWVWTPGVNWEYPLMPGLPVPDTYPVAQVSWKDAAHYCACMGGRLPTEAEWEYAARAGQRNQLFPWGNEWKPVRNGVPQVNGPDTSTQAVYSNMRIFEMYTDGYATFAPVGSFPANDNGLFDMSGNVWEWCHDDFYYSRYQYGPNVIPPDSLHRNSKVVRGGTWAYAPEQHRLSERGVFEARDFWTASLGFRCVLGKPE